MAEMQTGAWTLVGQTVFRITRGGIFSETEKERGLGLFVCFFWLQAWFVLLIGNWDCSKFQV